VFFTTRPFCIAYREKLVMTSHEITVVVATTSPLKQNAVALAFDREFTGHHVHIVTYKAASHINEQPVGFQETIKGATNRLEEAKKQAIKNNIAYQFIVAIENGIIEIATQTKESMWMDVGWIMLQDFQGRNFVASSCGIPFPNSAVQKAKTKGFDKTTVGQILSEANPACDNTDPHLFLTGHVISRKAMLDQAVSCCLGQWKYNKDLDKPNT